MTPPTNSGSTKVYGQPNLPPQRAASEVGQEGISQQNPTISSSIRQRQASSPAKLADNPPKSLVFSRQTSSGGNRIITPDMTDTAATAAGVLSNVGQAVAAVLNSPSGASVASGITGPITALNAIGQLVGGVKENADINKTKQDAKEAAYTSRYAATQYMNDIKELPNTELAENTKRLMMEGNRTNRAVNLSQSGVKHYMNPKPPPEVEGSNQTPQPPTSDVQRSMNTGLTNVAPGNNKTPKLNTKFREPLEPLVSGANKEKNTKGTTPPIFRLKSVARLKSAEDENKFLKAYAKEKSANKTANIASTTLAVGGNLSSAVSSTVGTIGYFLEAPSLGLASTATGIIGGCCSVGLSAKGLYDDYKDYKDLANRRPLEGPPLAEQPFFTNASSDQQKLFQKCDQLLPTKAKIRFSVASHSIGASVGLIATGTGIAALAGATFGLALPIIFGVGALAGIGFAAIQLTEQRQKKKADEGLLNEFQKEFDNSPEESDNKYVTNYLKSRGKDPQKVEDYLEQCSKKLMEVKGLKDTSGISLDKDSIKANTKKLQLAQREALKFMKLARES